MIDAQQIRNMMKENKLFFGKRCLDSRKSGKFAMVLYKNVETESLIDVIFLNDEKVFTCVDVSPFGCCFWSESQ